MSESVDVLVVGAGLAGLTAARKLQQTGLSVVVCEARDRVGGRTWSKDFGSARFDVGGQWLAPNHARMQALVAELGLETFPTYTDGKSVLFTGKKIVEYEGTIPRLSPWKLIAMQKAAWQIDRLVGKFDKMSRDDWQQLDTITLQQWAQRHLPSATGIEIMAAGLRVVFGAEPSELSMAWVVQYVKQSGGIMPLLEAKDGAQDTRIVAGAGSISELLADEIVNLKRSAPVTEVETGSDGLVVTADQEISARAVVVAVPPALQQQIRFRPGLPDSRGQLLQRMPMGATTKSLVIYDEPFWRGNGLSGEAVLTRGPVSVAFDNTSYDQAVPALVAFSVGAAARRLARYPADQRRRLVLGSLARCFGPQARRPIDFHEQDWQQEPWSRGCPTGNFAAGTYADFAPELAQPLGNIFWAGTETATEFVGFMEGAVQSGERAAHQVVSALG